MVLEWTSRTAYAFTELIFFFLVCLIIFATIAIVFIVLLLAYWGENSFFSLLRPLLDNVFTSAIAFSQRREEQVKIVFLGSEQQGDEYFKNRLRRGLARAWVHIYFTLLCSIAVLWFATVFSDAVLYRKTGTCLDQDVRDSDTRCFLLSTADVPPEVQEIIDEEEGEAVPCQRVQNYLILHNSTYDLEVICYLGRLSPLPALGVAYGTMKTIIFAVVSVLTVFLALSNKVKAPEWSLCYIIFTHAVQIGISVFIIAIMVAIVSSLHESNTRNTTFDFLRGERFYHSSIVGLGAVTILITFGLFPWWAFKPLEPSNAPAEQGTNGPAEQGTNGPAEQGTNRPAGEGREAKGGNGEEENKDMLDTIHRMILFHQFSIRYRSNNDSRGN